MMTRNICVETSSLHPYKREYINTGFVKQPIPFAGLYLVGVFLCETGLLEKPVSHYTYNFNYI